MTFKVGDRVRYTGKSAKYSTPSRIGKTGTVIGVKAYDSESVRVDWDDLGITISHYPENLELLPAETATKAPTFKAGDRVKINAPEFPFAHGRLGTVVSDVTLLGFVGVKLDGCDSAGGWHAYQLEPVPADPKVGDFIVVIRDAVGSLHPAARPAVHANFDAATKEAERLATVSPGDEFLVFRAVAVARAEKPVASTTTL